MAEKRHEGGISYHTPDQGLFRSARAPASRRRLLAVGARRRRGHLGRFLRLEFGLRRRRLGRHVRRHHHHHHHVSRPHLFHRRDEPGAAAYRRRLFLRSHRLRAVGRLHHRRRREHRICADPGGDRLLHRHLSHGDFRHARRVPAALVDLRLHRLRRAQHPRRRAVVHGHHHDDAARHRHSRGVLHQRDSVFRFRQIRVEHRRRPGDRSGNRAAARPWSVPSLRDLRRPCRHAVCGLAVSRHRAAAARGGRIRRTPNATCRKASCSACSR